jgi:hypothetical protein
MKTTQLALLMSVFTCFIWLSSPVALASESVSSFQVETTSYFVSTERLPVGDEKGHFIGLGKREGEAIFPNGETAKYLNIYTLDFRLVGGTATGYSKFIFDDDSTIICSWTAEIPIANGLFSKQGEGTIVKGTGRFEGLKGTTVLTGKQLKPASQDPKLTATTTYTFTLL